MKRTLWADVEELSSGHPIGTVGFTLHMHDGQAETLLRCLNCDAEYPQTDKGRDAIRRHEFEMHERLMRYTWDELDGLPVTIRVVRRMYEDWDGKPKEQVELVAVAADGTIYCLPDPSYGYGSDGSFKFRPRAKASRLLEPEERAPERVKLMMGGRP